MEEPKINFNMTAIDAANILSDGNFQVANIILNLVRFSDEGIYYAICLEHHGIYGENILKLFNFCAKSNYDLLQITLKLIDLSPFTKQQIQNNLSLETPVEFIDSEVVKEYFQGDISETPMQLLLNLDFQSKIKSVFLQKYETAISQSNPAGIGSQPGEDE